MSQPLEPKYEAYRPRPIRFEGTRKVEGHRLKLYSIRYGSRPVRWGVFEKGLAIAFDALPQPVVSEGRPGVGFGIAHQGRGADYVVLGWWDRENELPTKVFVREGDEWRPARESESFCVWDLQIMWHERQVYVSTVLAESNAGAVDRYMAQPLQAGSEAT